MMRSRTQGGEHRKQHVEAQETDTNTSEGGGRCNTSVVIRKRRKEKTFKIKQEAQNTTNTEQDPTKKQRVRTNHDTIQPSNY